MLPPHTHTRARNHTPFPTSLPWQTHEHYLPGCAFYFPHLQGGQRSGSAPLEVATMDWVLPTVTSPATRENARSSFGWSFKMTGGLWERPGMRFILSLAGVSPTNRGAYWWNHLDLWAIKTFMTKHPQMNFKLSALARFTAFRRSRRSKTFSDYCTKQVARLHLLSIRDSGTLKQKWISGSLGA